MSEQAQGAGARANTGGPAHPFLTWQSPQGFGIGSLHEGLTIRDHFAGLALPALISHTELSILNKIAKERSVSMVQAFGIMAYEYADAMLAARGQ